MAKEQLSNLEITKNQKEIKISKKRIIGVAFFAAFLGLILGDCIESVIAYVIPEISSMFQKIINSDTVSLNLIIRALSIFFATFIAGFLSKKKGVFAGLLTSLFYCFFLLVIIPVSIFFTSGAFKLLIDPQFYNAIQHIFFNYLLIFTFPIGVLGGFLGEKCYSPDIDLDLAKDKITIFGIQWFHYFWILPFIFWIYVAAFIIIGCLCILAFSGGLYFIIHPSLWLSTTWKSYFYVISMVVSFALGLVTVIGLVHFFKLMQYKQTGLSEKWRKFGQILLYGIAIPGLSYFIATICVRMSLQIYQNLSLGIWIIALSFISIPIVVIIVSRILKKIH